MKIAKFGKWKMYSSPMTLNQIHRLIEGLPDIKYHCNNCDQEITAVDASRYNDLCKNCY